MKQRNRVVFLHLLFSAIVILAVVVCGTTPTGDTPNFDGVRILVHVNRPPGGGIPPIDTTTIAEVKYKNHTVHYETRYQVTEMNKDGFHDIILTLKEESK